MSARIQKFFAAKAAATTQGRNLIKSLLGEHGEKLISIMYEFSLTTTGEKDKAKITEKAQALEEALFKVTAKLVVLIHTNKIKFNQFASLVVPTRAFLWSLIDACEMTSFGYEAKSLTAYMDIIIEGIDKILQPHVTGRSLERTKMLQTFWANKATLDKFMQDEKLKIDFADELTKVLEELEVRRDIKIVQEEKKDSK